jgi:hypothetical protein
VAGEEGFLDLGGMAKVRRIQQKNLRRSSLQVEKEIMILEPLGSDLDNQGNGVDNQGNGQKLGYFRQSCKATQNEWL